MTRIAQARRRFPAAGVILAMVALVFLAAVDPALGQMSEEDIQALKKQGEQEGWTFTVRLNDATKYSLKDLCGIKEPPDMEEAIVSDYIPPASTSLPASFDWRSYDGVTPVRNQGACGSCWAFATVGVLESNIKIKDGVGVDLSEQHLVSCNWYGWGCDGGWEAFNFYYSVTDDCGQIGAVLESDFPYAAADVSCVCPKPRHYTIDNRVYVDPAIWIIPSVDQMKQAIYNYGPIWVSVYANSSFHAYGGGVYNDCNDVAINHAVVLVGWDDTQGIWYLRNSWGTGWGEGGYMRIAYGCARVGYKASYVVYDGGIWGPNSWQNVRIGGSYYQTLQDAYNAASNGTVIQCKAVPLEGGVTASKDQIVTIAGGYNDDWSAVVGKTTVMGPIVMQAGQLVFQNDILDQNGTTVGAAPDQQPEPASAELAAEKTTSEEDALLPDDFYLKHNYPNPFNPSTTIEFGLPSNSQVRLDIFNILGQRVMTLVDNQMAAGHHTILWNGKSEAGESVSSGVYLYRIQTDEFNQTRKMLMLK